MLFFYLILTDLTCESYILFFVPYRNSSEIEFNPTKEMLNQSSFLVTTTVNLLGPTGRPYDCVILGTFRRDQIAVLSERSSSNYTRKTGFQRVSYSDCHVLHIKILDDPEIGL